MSLTANATGSNWVLMSYRLPREPSAPRIALWRKLRRLGVAQVLDGLVALPLDAPTREQLEWLAEEVLDSGGEAGIWIAQPASEADDRAMIDRMREAAAEEYRAVGKEALAAARRPAPTQRRTLARLRRELQRIAGRDHFGAPQRQEATAALEKLARRVEVAS